jgi:hypothetical protein
MIKNGSRNIPFLRITRKELENLDYLHRCVAEALTKTGEVVVIDTVEMGK